MVILSAQRMQKLAQSLQQLEQNVEAAGSEIEDRVERESERSLDSDHHRELEEDLTAAAGRMGVELTTLRTMDLGTLTRLLSGGAGAGSGRIWAAGEILFVDGLLAERRHGTRNAEIDSIMRIQHAYTCGAAVGRLWL